MIVNPYVFGNAGGGVLDLFQTELWFAGGIARYLSAYSGPLLRVRRSSDGSEADIGALSDNTLDVASLLAFCGSGDGFVTKIYGQQTTSNDMVQTAIGSQSRIVNAGVYSGSVVLDGANDGFGSTINTTASRNGFTAYVDATLRNTSGVYVYMELDTNYNGADNDPRFIAYYDNTSGSEGTYLAISQGSGGVYSIERLSQVPSGLTVFRYITSVPANSQEDYFTGSTKETPISRPHLNGGSVANFIAQKRVYFGGRAGTTVGSPFDLRHLALYSSEATDADVAAIVAALSTL